MKRRFIFPTCIFWGFHDDHANNGGCTFPLHHCFSPEDLTPLLAEYEGPLAQPIIAAAGSDISFWFDEAVRGTGLKKVIMLDNFTSKMVAFWKGKWGGPLISGKSRLVKCFEYCNLGRFWRNSNILILGILGELRSCDLFLYELDTGSDGNLQGKIRIVPWRGVKFTGGYV